MYRGLRLWEAAVREAGSLDQDDVVKIVKSLGVIEPDERLVEEHPFVQA